MTNIKENNLDKFKKELDSVKIRATELKIVEEKQHLDFLEQDTLDEKIILTEIIEKKEKLNTINKNDEIISSLSEIQLNLEKQYKILSNLIDKLKNVKLFVD